MTLETDTVTIIHERTRDRVEYTPAMRARAVTTNLLFHAEYRTEKTKKNKSRRTRKNRTDAARADRVVIHRVVYGRPEIIQT